MILDGYLCFTNSAANGGDLPTTGTQTATNILDLGGPQLPASVNGLQPSRDLGIGDGAAHRRRDAIKGSIGAAEANWGSSRASDAQACFSRRA